MAFDPFDDNQEPGENMTIVDGSDASKQAGVYGTDVQNADLIKQAGVNTVSSISTSATEAKVGGSRHAGRKQLIIQSQGDGLYWGYTSGVTTANGFRMNDGDVVCFAIDDATEIYLISDSSTDAFIGEA